jgi:hypothetical protein
MARAAAKAESSHAPKCWYSQSELPEQLYAVPICSPTGQPRADTDRATKRAPPR